jgi:hypothetical protein
MVSTFSTGSSKQPIKKQSNPDTAKPTTGSRHPTADGGCRVASVKVEHPLSPARERRATLNRPPHEQRGAEKPVAVPGTKAPGIHRHTTATTERIDRAVSEPRTPNSKPHRHPALSWGQAKG